MMQDDDREVMGRSEAEDEVGSDFNRLPMSSRPVVICPHKIFIQGRIYSPEELEALACLTRIYGEDRDVCRACEDEEREREEEEKPRKGKKSKRDRDDY